MADEKAKGRDEILTEINQRMVNQRDLSQIEIGVMLSGMIEGNKDASDVIKRCTSKETAW